MSRIYDNWERLVEATLNREKLRELAFCESFNTSIASDFSSRFSFDSLNVNEASRDSISPEASSSQSLVRDFAACPTKFEEIIGTTRNFGWVLGEGRFGPVFKGWIHEHSLTAAKPGSGMEVAVRLLSPRSVEERERWLAEISYLGQLHHPNLIKLVGYCSEEDKLILVYEFMSKGSLSFHLFNRGPRPLAWGIRVKVAIGAARALSFLHDREKQVIHKGVQSSNILLDSEFNAKLSDFGLADVPSGDMTYLTSSVRRTYGYDVPLDMTIGPFTAKSDVYSFGVVLLELLVGSRAWDSKMVQTEIELVDWAKPYMLEKRKLIRIMDSKLKGQYPKKEAYRVAALAMKCLNHNPKRRPKMSEVLVELENL